MFASNEIGFGFAIPTIVCAARWRTVAHLVLAKDPFEHCSLDVLGHYANAFP